MDTGRINGSRRALETPRIKQSELWKYGVVRILYPLLSRIGYNHADIFRRLKNRVRHPQWTAIVRRTTNRDVFRPQPDNQRIVLLSMVGNMPLTHFEIPLALALQARGANVEFVLCDGRQRRLCSQLTIDALERASKSEKCGHCLYNGLRLLKDVPEIRTRTSGEFVSEQKSDELWSLVESLGDAEIGDFEYEGARIGLAAAQTAMRYWRKGTSDGTPEETQVVREMAHSALITHEICKALDAEGEISAALFSHGIYESWGPAADYFTNRGIYWATYGEQARKNTYVFTANESCRLADIRKGYDEQWRDRRLTASERQEAVSYLRSRADFSQDTLKLTMGANFESHQVLDKLGLDPAIPILTLFGNVPWDASAVGRDLIFEDFTDWVIRTIQFVADRNDNLQLVVKPHPSEFIRGTRQSLLGEIEKVFPKLPQNVVTMSPTTDINAHSVMNITTTGLVHTSTVGMEMSIQGVPTVVSSWTHYRGYGFTFDPESQAQYFEFIANPRELRKKMTQEMTEEALKYFYVRCFHSWIELPLVHLDQNRAPFGWQIGNLDELLPGHIRNLDFVCDRILRKADHFLLE